MSENVLSSEFYNTLIKTHEYIVNYSKSNSNKAIELFNLPLLGKKKSKKHDPLKSYLDELFTLIEESCFIKMISEFERLLFTKFKNASEELKSKVEGILENTTPFKNCETKFILSNENIDRISRILPFVGEKIQKKEYDKLKDFIDFRNYLAHGKRFVPSEIVYSFDTKYTFNDVVNTLNNILKKI